MHIEQIFIVTIGMKKALRLINGRSAFDIQMSNYLITRVISAGNISDEKL